MTITKLYADFEMAFAAYRQIPESDARRADSAIGECSELAFQIVKTRANSIDEMLIKIRMAGWCSDCGPDADKIKNLAGELDRWTVKEPDPEGLYALVSLREDLRHLQRQAA